jgi:sulfite reductase alpha subunit-like flavoprotein
MTTPLVLYAGETGNAEEVAYDVQAKLPLAVRIMNIAQFDVLDLPSEKHILFIVSTTGDGDIPEGMKSFWNFMLRRGLSSTSLADLSFSVLGLGDSSYDKYNAAARKLQKRLLMLGAKELVPMGLGDDQATYGYFTAYNTWLESLRNTLAPAPAEGLPLPVKKTTTYSIQRISGDTNMDVEHSNSPEDAIVLAEVVENKRLTADVWAQDVRHLKLRHASPISDRYAVGDVALVHYCNPPELVQQAAAMICEGGRLHEGCEYTLNTVLSINCTVPAGVAARPSRLSNLPHCTLGTLLERHLDIGAVPKRSYFAALAPYATSTEEADKLRELASAQGTDLYHDYCIRERKSYVEVLQEFRSCRPPLAVLLGAVQLICPRQYSIACAPLTNPHEVRLCVSACCYLLPLLCLFRLAS